jgi:hypothetical protein
MKLSPSTMLKVHAGAGLACLALWVVAIPTGWVNSPAFISHVSMLALVYTAFTGWQAAMAGKEAESGD